MNTVLGLSLACALLLLGAGEAGAYITKTGNVSGQDWAPGTYWVTGDLSVNAGSTLTIQPGAVIKFAPNTGLRVNGTLIAQGSEIDPIVFSARDDNAWGEAAPGSDGTPLPGDWDGIQCYGYLSNEGVGQFTWCRIRYGGSTAGAYQANLYFYFSDAAAFSHGISEYSLGSGVRSYNCPLALDNSSCAQNQVHGLQSSNGGRISVHGCVFSDNTQYGAWLSAINPGDFGGNSGSGNTPNGLGLSGVLTESEVWTANALGFPYVLLGTLTVNTPDTLQLRPGVVVKCLPASDIQAIGVLTLAGTEDSLVVLTSLKDDSWSGDTNGDGAATSPAPGDWEGIEAWGYLSNIGWVEADWCLLRYGGSSASVWDANLYYGYSDGGHFRNSRSEFSQTVGVKVYSCAAVLEHSVCHGNLGHGLEGGVGNVLAVSNCSFTDNGGYGAWLAGGRPCSSGGNGGDGNGTNGFAVNGITDGSIVWSPNQTNFPYILGGDVTVSNGDTLRLKPGVVIKSIPTGQLSVDGVLQAAGSADSLVVFTSLKDDSWAGDTNSDGAASSPAPGDWRGITCWGYLGLVGEGDFNWCSVNYGGNAAGTGDANVYFGYSDRAVFHDSQANYSAQAGLRVGVPAVVRDSHFSGNLGAGITSESDGQPDIHGCVFTNNATIGAELLGTRLGSFGGNSGSGNGVNGLGIRGSVVHQVWEANAETFPYVLRGDVAVALNDTLWLGPGVLLKGQAGTELAVNGTLVGAGSESAPIRFTSHRDDAWGGDSNGDGAATTPAPGDWDGLRCWGYLTSQGDALLDHFAIRHGGGGGNAANLYVYSSVVSTFNNGEITRSADSGIRCIDSNPILGNCLIADNLGLGVLVTSGTARLGGCDDSAGGYNRIWGNNGGGFQMENNSSTVVAACYNDWGVYTEAGIDALLDDDEESSAAEIRFDPFMLEAGPTTITHVNVNAAGDAITLYWRPVRDASGYAVQSSFQPWEGFATDGSGVFLRSHWTGPVSGLMRYYQVRVITE